MTCIVAIAHKNKIYMGADSYGSDGYSGDSVLNPKCFINDEFIIGCTTSFRIIDLLRYELSVPKLHNEEYNNPDKFMRTHFIRAVRQCFKDNGHTTINNNNECGGNFLVGYHGALYEIQNDFSVLNKPRYGNSVGSGAAAARGSLWTTRSMKMKPTERLKIALESAVTVNTGVRGPFIMLEL